MLTVRKELLNLVRLVPKSSIVVSLPKSWPFKIREKIFNFKKQSHEKIKIYRSSDCFDTEAAR
ncbi:MAG: hypothetical protein JWO44_1625, partial [Bacteroidetes bacterium]|nr:hypothetical protein [Bacteroidota bacterium]